MSNSWEKSNGSQILKYLLADLLQNNVWWSLHEIMEINWHYFQVFMTGRARSSLYLVSRSKFLVQRVLLTGLELHAPTLLSGGLDSLTDIPTKALTNEWGTQCPTVNPRSCYPGVENRCQAGKNNRSLVHTLPHSSHVAIQIHFSKIKICTHIVCVLEPQVVHKYSKTEMMALHSRGLLYSIFF